MPVVIFHLKGMQLRFERSDHPRTHRSRSRHGGGVPPCRANLPEHSASMRIDRRAVSAAGGVGAAVRTGVAAGDAGGGAITAAGPALRADFLRAGRALTGDHRQPRESRRGAHRRCPRGASRPATHRGPARTPHSPKWLPHQGLPDQRDAGRAHGTRPQAPHPNVRPGEYGHDVD